MRFARALVGPLLMVFALVDVPTAGAECTSVGGTTICSQGEVRGSDADSAPTGSSGPYVPYPCGYDWYYCNHLWGFSFGAEPMPGGSDPEQPGEPEFSWPGGGGWPGGW